MCNPSQRDSSPSALRRDRVAIDDLRDRAPVAAEWLRRAFSVLSGAAHSVGISTFAAWAKVIHWGQSLKGSHRAYRVLSTPMTGRNIATQRFFSLGPRTDIRIHSKLRSLVVSSCAAWRLSLWTITHLLGGPNHRLAANLTFSFGGSPDSRADAHWLCDPAVQSRHTRQTPYGSRILRVFVRRSPAMRSRGRAPRSQSSPT
jgi:hypothetical protein